MAVYFCLIPAHAGVIPLIIQAIRDNGAYPRARGGDPVDERAGRDERRLSPRTRG
mgnify:FL=1